MIASHALKALAAGAVFLLSANGALAQVQLIPGGETNVLEPASPLLPAPSADRPTTTPDLPQNTPSTVTVESLESVDIEAIGALPSSIEALPADLWSGLSRTSITALLEGLPGNWALPAARNLALRLLLSPASLPKATATDQTGTILRARIAALLRLGAASEAADLAGVGQDVLTTDADLEILAGTKLAAYDLVGACGDAGRIAPNAQTVFWQKLLIFCQAVAGRKDEASLAASTLLDLGVMDPIFFTLIEDIGLGLTADLRDLSPKGPLHYAMLRFSEARLSKEPKDAAIAALAVAQDTDVDRAEAALAKGLVSPALVEEKYRAEKFKATALENPIAVLERVSVPARRALLFQSTEHYEIPALKAEAIAAALAQSRGDGRFTVAAQLFVGPARTLPPSPDLLWFAEDAAMLFYVAGDRERGAAWHALARTAAPTDPAAAAADKRLWHLAVLAGQSGANLSRSQQGWASAIADGLEDPQIRVGALTALVEAATGMRPLSTDATARRAAMAVTLDTSSAPRASGLLLHRLSDAAKDERVGETVALALAALATLEAANLDLLTVTQVVSALEQIGLLTEARRLALEAAVLSEPLNP